MAVCAVLLVSRYFQDQVVYMRPAVNGFQECNCTFTLSSVVCGSARVAEIKNNLEQKMCSEYGFTSLDMYT